MMEKITKRGRPRGFDEGKVLDEAMKVFWKQGFGGASYGDLTEATGLNKPSLYAAFGDKEALFTQALRCYETEHLKPLREAFLAEPDFRKGLRDLLNGYLSLYAGPSGTSGCFLATSIADMGAPTFPDDIKRELRQAIDHTQAAYLARLTRARDEGDLPDGLTPDAALRFLNTFVMGIAHSAKAGLAGQGGGALLPAIDTLMRLFEA
jgi:AcrR family transcriptional regulator